MIIIKKIEIGFKCLENQQVPSLEDCYLIISTTDSTHFCSTVPFLGGRFNWYFNREVVRFNRPDRNLKANLKVIGYQSCKIINESQVELREVSSNGSNKAISKLYELKNRRITVYVQYSFERQRLIKSPSIAANLESGGKMVKTSQNHLSPELMHKISSWKLVPYKEREYGNILQFHSTKKVAERDLKVYRQCKDTKLSQNAPLTKILSYKLIE